MAFLVGTARHEATLRGYAMQLGIDRPEHILIRRLKGRPERLVGDHGTGVESWPRRRLSLAHALSLQFVRNHRKKSGLSDRRGDDQAEDDS